MIQAIGFDVGHTLIRYPSPLNWQTLYEPALRCVLRQCGEEVSVERIDRGAAILSQYNTRIHPREEEVSSDTILKEILGAWGLSATYLDRAKAAFYGFFQTGAVCYDDTAEALDRLKSKGIKLGALTDVAYGMDNAYSLRDLESIQSYLDPILTSIDVGYRKPHPAGYRMLLKAFNVHADRMIYVGDERKDIQGANALGIISVLIDRTGDPADYGQHHTISSLTQLNDLI